MFKHTRTHQRMHAPSTRTHARAHTLAVQFSHPATPLVMRRARMSTHIYTHTDTHAQACTDTNLFIGEHKFAPSMQLPHKILPLICAILHRADLSYHEKQQSGTREHQLSICTGKRRFRLRWGRSWLQMFLLLQWLVVCAST